MKPLIDYINESTTRRLIKEVTLKGVYYAAFMEKDSILIEWNHHPQVRAFTNSEWLEPTNKKGMYFTPNDWDELTEAVEALGGVKADKKYSHTSDWGNGDTDKFYKNIYDLSNILK